MEASSLAFSRTVAVVKTVLHDFLTPCLFLLTLTFLSGISPVLNLWISKLVIDRVVVYLTAGAAAPPLQPVVSALMLQLAVAVLSSVITRLEAYQSTRLSQLMTFKIQQDIFQYCTGMDFAFFETPQQQDKLHRTQHQSSQAATSLFTAVINLSRRMVTIVSSSAALFLFSPILCLVAVAAAVPNFVMNVRLAFQYYELIKERSPRVRKTAYISSLLLQRNYARDNILFGIGNYFLSKWRELQTQTLREDLGMHLKRVRIGEVGSLVGRFAHFGSYVYVVWLAGKKSESVGAVVMNVGLFASAQAQIQGIANDLANLYQNAIFLNDYYELQRTPSQIEQQETGIALDENIVSMAFHNVSFTYPGSHRYALQDVSFEIKNHECVCLVGANGAGKSTIVKLLLRLYDPDSGTILINGRNIKDYHPRSLRRSFGVLMQDYSRYLLSIKENIVVGDLERPTQENAVLEALRSADLQDRVNALAKKENTLLGKIFGDGEDLSVGEWQKLALARIFFRDASVYVLDEPTSALDARTEETVLRNFRRQSNDKMAIIVSHRFSSARIADKVMVVDSGKIAEVGTHTQLMEKNGLYARLFLIQQKRYLGEQASEHRRQSRG